MALAFRQRSLKPFKFSPLHSHAVGWGSMQSRVQELVSRIWGSGLSADVATDFIEKGFKLKNSDAWEVYYTA